MRGLRKYTARFVAKDPTLHSAAEMKRLSIKFGGREEGGRADGFLPFCQVFLRNCLMIKLFFTGTEGTKAELGMSLIKGSIAFAKSNVFTYVRTLSLGPKKPTVD